ncbi:MAG TPA: asparaginase [Candidatus Nitrosotalea sp.]|nr:asparaginase [Candidatus Nitrosotalea sp.]
MTGNPELIVEVTRGELAESFHRVAACAVGVDGGVLYHAGEIDAPVYLRSAAKPFIAAAAVEAGAVSAFALDSRELAVMAASHSGEPFHVEAVRSILSKIGMDETALQCGVHYPYDETAANALRRAGESPSPLHNNCSGKHAGILALCKLIGADPATYLRAENPAQRRILDLCARLSGDDASTWPLGTDGCGIPVYATSLRNAAHSFARLASLQDMRESDAAALQLVRDAMVAHPEYVAGTGQFDTELMTAGGRTIAAKGGAEGIQGVAAIAKGFGYVSKVLDGSGRARGPATVAVLRALGVLDAQQEAQLARFAHPSVYNRAGHVVGEIRAIL